MGSLDRPHDVCGDLLGGLEFLWSGKDLGVLLAVGALREFEELRLVLLQAFGIASERFEALIATAVVHSNAEGSGLSDLETCSLDFGWGEATSESGLGVVSDRAAPHNRAEGLQWSGEQSCSLGGTSSAPSQTASWLVEPGLHAPLPVLVEMLVRDGVVVLHDLESLRGGR